MLDLLQNNPNYKSIEYFDGVSSLYIGDELYVE